MKQRIKYASLHQFNARQRRHELSTALYTSLASGRAACTSSTSSDDSRDGKCGRILWRGALIGDLLRVLSPPSVLRSQQPCTPSTQLLEARNHEASSPDDPPRQHPRRVFFHPLARLDSIRRIRRICPVVRGWSSGHRPTQHNSSLLSFQHILEDVGRAR